MTGKEDARKYGAEFVGTFVLVFLGCGSLVMGATINTFSVLTIAFAFGLSLMAMFYAIGGISGCHINPAVSLSMFAAGKIKTKDAAVYIVMQCVGAIVGAAALYWIATGSPSYSLAYVGLGENGYGTRTDTSTTGSPGGFSMASAFVAELILTFIFVLVIHGATSEKTPKGFAGIAIGLTLVVIHIVGIPITGTSVNPARSLGPAVIVGGEALTQLWLFWVAPILGGLLAAAVWKLLE
jgi:aquaporin Z